jgi:hypothetical protein
MLLKGGSLHLRAFSECPMPPAVCGIQKAKDKEETALLLSRVFIKGSGIKMTLEIRK